MRKGNKMRAIGTILFVAILALGVIEAGAADPDALQIEGSYIVYLENGHQRVLSFDRSGNVVDVSDLEAVYGFTTGLGAWEQTGPASATARVIDFNFALKSGEKSGPAVIKYEFTFGDLAEGKYQTVKGSLSGGQYESGQDPLAPTKDPIRKFGQPFTGKRITAK